MFNPGKEVSWKSQGGGVTKEKKGEIIAFVPKGAVVTLGDTYTPVSPSETVIRSIPEGTPRCRIKFDMCRAECDRYLIAVPRGTEGDSEVDYYCPRASVIHRQHEQKLKRLLGKAVH